MVIKLCYMWYLLVMEDRILVLVWCMKSKSPNSRAESPGGVPDPIKLRNISEKSPINHINWITWIPLIVYFRRMLTQPTIQETVGNQDQPHCQTLTGSISKLQLELPNRPNRRCIQCTSNACATAPKDQTTCYDWWPKWKVVTQMAQ